MKANLRKVLYISYDGMTDPLGQSQVIPYLQGLVKAGHEITILSCEKQQRFHEQKAHIQKLLEEAGIGWEPILYHKSPPILSTLWDLLQLFRHARKVIDAKNCDLIHCRSYIPSLIGLHFRRSRNIPFLFDMRGFWADERVDGNLWRLDNPIYKLVYQFFKRREADFLRESFCTVSLTHAAKEEIGKWPVGNSVHIEVIPCCADLDFFSFQNVSVEKKDKLKKELAIPGKIILYLGSLGTWYMLDEMLDCYQSILSKNEEYYFLFLTPDDPNLVYAMAKQRGIPQNRLIVRKAIRSEVPVYLSLATCGLFFIKPSYSKMSSSPTKLGELLGMGIPVITNGKVGDADYFFEKFPVGILIQEFTKPALDKVSEQIAHLEILSKSSIRSAALEYFSLTKGIESYKLIYESCPR